MKAGNARMSDVAKLAGVSNMTVSRVLNGSPQVTEELRKRVLSAVEQLKYKPNELARSLREQRSRQIGIIIPYLYDPFFAICAHAVSAVAKGHGYSVVIATSNEDPETEFHEASRMLRRNVDGMVIIPAHTGGAPSLLLDEEFKACPIVSLDRPIDDSRYDSFLVDNEGGARIGTEHLIQLGHKRIVYIGLSDDLYTMEMRHKGFLSAMAAAKLAPRSLILSGELEHSVEAIGKLTQGRGKPTALFCANNLLTRHVLHSLQAFDLHPPTPVALVGFDDFETADLLRPGVTVLRQPIEQLAREAAHCLFSQLANRNASQPTERRILPVEFILRGSCGSMEAG